MSVFYVLSSRGLFFGSICLFVQSYSSLRSFTHKQIDLKNSLTICQSQFTEPFLKRNHAQSVPVLELSHFSTCIQLLRPLRNTSDRPLMRLKSYQRLDDRSCTYYLAVTVINTQNAAAETTEASGKKPRATTLMPFMQGGRQPPLSVDCLPPRDCTNKLPPYFSASPLAVVGQ